MRKISYVIGAVLLISLLCTVNATPFDINTPVLSYTSYTNRPGNFILSDIATASGHNSFQASVLATVGGIDEVTKVSTLPANPGSSPEEKSLQQIYMDFFKDGSSVDPAMWETIKSDITVGTKSNAIIPTFDDNGNIPTNTLSEGYDIATMTVGGVAGTPISNNHVLTGIVPDYQRYVFSNIQSYQDDYISYTGEDSAGTNSNVLTSYTTASVSSPAMLGVDTPYVKFGVTDMRGYRVDASNVNGPIAWSGAPDWTIQTNVNYEEVLPWTYRSA
jgi:hypothetical protein